MDELVERVIKDVWQTYDVKNQGFIDKKKAAQFFKVRPHRGYFSKLASFCVPKHDSDTWNAQICLGCFGGLCIEKRYENQGRPWPWCESEQSFGRLCHQGMFLRFRSFPTVSIVVLLVVIIIYTRLHVWALANVVSVGFFCRCLHGIVEQERQVCFILPITDCGLIHQFESCPFWGKSRLSVLLRTSPNISLFFNAVVVSLSRSLMTS